MSGSVRVTLLGPPRVLRDGVPVDLGGPKQQAVAAVLALAGGRPCPPHDLAACLWGTAVPASAAGTLRAYVSRLRSRLPDGTVGHSAAGWWLAVDREDVDALRFADLVAAADAAAGTGAGTGSGTGAGDGADPGPTDEDRRMLLESALGLWQGPALAGLTHLPFAVRERGRLDDLRAGAQEALLGLRLDAGEHREVVPDASDLVARHPHREGPVRHLAVALARAGRHADALAAVDALRGRLAEDLGLDLPPAMAELHRRLLLHDPDLLLARPAGERPAGEPPEPRTSPAQPPGAAPPVTVGPGAARTQPTLPLPLTSFVGRAPDIRSVHEALASARLVTLAGPGGAGKTRLALEALRRLPDDAVDGPWVVELGTVTEPAQVPDAVAQALGVATSSAADARLLADALRGRRVLLVLDNCEHLAGPVADLVAHLLAACGGVQVLATSREVLAVAGERVVTVAPMRWGRPGAPGEAELLFAERATSADPGFRLDDRTGPAVHRLVRALDGIPLAVELAAARLSVMGLDDMLAMLGDRFTLLEGGTRSALPHQRTLAAAVAWSHDLLDDDERRLFGVASGFAGPFTLPALRTVADGEVGRPVLGVLASLTAKSMVQVDRPPDLRASRTYRLLETMRAYGRERLDPASRDRIADRHAGWFAAEAAEAYGGLRGPDTRRWLTHLDLVRPDLRAALRHAVHHGDAARAQRLVGGLGLYWFHRGHLQEGQAWVAAARDLAGPVDDATRARAALAAALLAYGQGDATHLDPVVLADLQRASATDADPSTAAVASVYAGYVEAAFGRLENAQVSFVRAGELVAGGAVEPWAVAEVLFAQGQLLRAQGLRPQALEVLRQAAQVGDGAGHAWAAGSARYIAAKVHLDDRRGPAALDALAATLPSTLDLGIATSTLAVLQVAAAALAAVERHADAAAVLGTVDAWAERLGYHPARMDPLDGERHRGLVREGLEPAGYDAAWRSGRSLTLAAAADRVLAAAAGRPRRGTGAVRA